MKSQQSPDAVDRIEKPVALMVSLVILRVAIGWHFLYEGVVKLLADDWSAGPFLAQSRWLLSGLFHWMAETPAVLHVAFRCDDVAATRERLLAAGASPAGDIADLPGGARIVMLRDPWGLAIQLTDRSDLG